MPKGIYERKIKPCSRCGVVLDTGRRSGLCASCKIVSSKESNKKWYDANSTRKKESLRAWRKVNPDKVKMHKAKEKATKSWTARMARAAEADPEAHKRAWYKRMYGISYADFLALAERQRWCCAICGRSVKGNKNAHLDHNHETGKVRAILCRACNTALGMFQDSTIVLLNAIEYLDEHNGHA